MYYWHFVYKYMYRKMSNTNAHSVSKYINLQLLSQGYGAACENTADIWHNIYSSRGRTKDT